jgi:hypothetical protein
VTVFRLALPLGAVALLATATAVSQPTSEAAPAPPAGSPSSGSPPAPPAATGSAPSATCYPACREGFTCHLGRCISLCNPPCPEHLECVEGRRCEPPLPGGGSKPYEPPAPKAKSFEQRNHALAGFHLGFPGSFERDETKGNLGTTLGFNIRGDTPIATYVLLGPMFQLGAWAPDVGPEVSSSYYLDLDLVLRLRAPLTTSKLNYQIWLGLPVGLTVNVLGDHPEAVSGIGLGWNIGVLFGGAVHFSPKFGLFGEFGWLQHRMSHSAEVGQDVDFELQQGCFNVGIVVRN